eukprot:3712892-Amphidinium_carterae.1
MQSQQLSPFRHATATMLQPITCFALLWPLKSPKAMQVQQPHRHNGTIAAMRTDIAVVYQNKPTTARDTQFFGPEDKLSEYM